MRRMQWNFKVLGRLILRWLDAAVEEESNEEQAGLIFPAGVAPNVSVRTLGPRHVITPASSKILNVLILPTETIPKM